MKKAIVLSINEEDYKKLIGEYPNSQRELNTLAKIISENIHSSQFNQIWHKVYEQCRKVIALNKLRETKTKTKTIKRKLK